MQLCLSKKGTKHNFVIWIFGAGGDVRIAPYGKEEWLGVIERWENDGKEVPELKSLLSHYYQFLTLYSV